MGSAKLIRKLLGKPVEMRIDEVATILLHFGYKLVKIRGSHFKFEKRNKPFILIPVHGKKVSKVYINDIRKVIINEFNLLDNEKKKIYIVRG
jgi:predicted RNA binding protein YcfA (HicA-like mRNA interferase family)